MYTILKHHPKTSFIENRKSIQFYKQEKHILLIHQLNC